MRLGYGILGMAAMLWGMSGAHAAASAESQDAYTPIFLMYTGEPSPERLQGLRQFLAANNTPKPLIKETEETVIYKLKNYKAGFAYPVFYSEDKSAGNACVVADGHHEHALKPIALMTNERIHRYVMGGRAPNMEEQPVLDTVLNHEIFHCYDLMRQSQIEIGTHVARDGSAYFSNWSETGADAFAALKHLRNGGDKQLIRQIRDFRTLNLLNGDAVHYTARTLDYIVWNFDQKRLKKLNMRQLVDLAIQIREQTALTPDEFAMIDQVSIRLDSELKALTGDVDREPGGYAMQTLQYTPPAPEYFSQLMLQVRTALLNLGGDAGSSNAYFYPLMKKYFRASQFRVERADASP